MTKSASTPPPDTRDPALYWNTALAYQQRSEWGHALVNWQHARGKGLNEHDITIAMAYCLEHAGHVPASLRLLESIQHEEALPPAQLAEVHLRRYSCFARMGLNARAAQHRLLCEELTTHPLFAAVGLIPEKHYMKQNLSGKRLLVVNYGGAGDHLQYARYLFALSQLCERITVIIPNSLMRLFQHNFPHIEFRASQATVPDVSGIAFDYWCSMMTLAISFDLEAWPKLLLKDHYLRCPQDTLHQWSAWVEQHRPNPTAMLLGLNWQGARTTDVEYQRNATPEDFGPLALLPNSRSFCVNREIAPGPQTGYLVCPGQEIQDFCDLAGLMLSLDQVVSTCTGPVHLAGALGVPTLLLLGPKTDPRWGLASKTSLYPSVQIIRCARAYQWKEGIDQALSLIQADFSSAAFGQSRM